MLVTLGGLLQAREDWEEQLPRKSSSCISSPKDTLARVDGKQSICRRLNAHAASGRPRDSAQRVDSWSRCSAFITQTDKGNPD
jgi:hypothetical protein